MIPTTNVQMTAGENQPGTAPRPNKLAQYNFKNNTTPDPMNKTSAGTSGFRKRWYDLLRLHDSGGSARRRPITTQRRLESYTERPMMSARQFWSSSLDEASLIASWLTVSLTSRKYLSRQYSIYILYNAPIHGDTVYSNAYRSGQSGRADSKSVPIVLA